MTKFKVGDKVVDEGNRWGTNNGLVGVVTDVISTNGGGAVYHASFGDDPFEWYYDEGDLEFFEATEDSESQNQHTSNVHSPSHYNEGGIECIDAIRASLGPEGFQAYCKGNCMKYLWRYAYKNGLEDLEKAQVYLGWMIESMKESQ